MFHCVDWTVYTHTHTYTLLLTYIVHIHWSWHTETCACFAYNMLSLLTFSLFFALHKLLISLWKLHKCRRSSTILFFIIVLLLLHLLFLLLASCCCLLSYHNSQRQHHNTYYNISLISQIFRVLQKLTICFLICQSILVILIFNIIFC